MTENDFIPPMASLKIKVLTKGRRIVYSYRAKGYRLNRGRNSVVECQLPKLNVVGSNPIARFFVSILYISACPHY
jgi:hypothetical protein